MRGAIPRAARVVSLVARASFVVVGLVACARSADHRDAKAPPAELGHDGVSPGAPAVPWAAKTREQRMEFMGLTFHPRMRELFVSRDAAAYDKFRCQTCHGEDMEARSFAMPATLAALGGEDDVATGRARDAKATDFMVREVLPLTVALLGEGDAAARARVGCGTCHARQ